MTILKKADAGNSDMMIAVTLSETTNLMCCLLSKQLGCKRTIARVTNIEFDKYKVDVDFNSLGIDELISPEELAVKEIQLLIDESAFNNSYEFEDGALTMMGTTLLESAPFVGKSVKEAAAVFSEVLFMPIAIKRAGTQTTLILVVTCLKREIRSTLQVPNQEWIINNWWDIPNRVECNDYRQSRIGKKQLKICANRMRQTR